MLLKIQWWILRGIIDLSLTITAIILHAVAFAINKILTKCRSFSTVQKESLRYFDMCFNPQWHLPVLQEQLRKNLKPTIAYCSVFWMFGMCVAFLGPTLLDLGCQTASDMQQISWVFFAQLLCSLIGSTAAGFMSKR